MAKNAGKSLNAIQKLLAERVQIEKWLDRLGLAGDSTPEAVRERVKKDYQARLKEVVRELGEYGDELKEALRRQQQTRDGLARQEKEAAEQLSEAEVRHAVGEYDEAKWRDIHAEHLGNLVKIREELKNAEEEIQRLDDTVQGLVAPAAPASAPPPPPPPPPSAAPVNTSASLGGQKARQGDAFDELAFLKSVTDDEKGRPNPARASGQQTVPEHIKPPAPAAAPAPAPPPPPPPPKAEEPKAPSLPPVDVGAAGVSAIDNSGPGKRMTAQLEKSLKCKECGTMNLPTEWYCEKCGAELSESL